ncbi:MAG: hypothetical protein ACREBT_00060 [Thermoplasmata archaeon]
MSTEAQDPTLPYGPAPYRLADPRAHPRPSPWMTRIALGGLIFIGIYSTLVVLPAFLFTQFHSAGLPSLSESPNMVLVGTLLAAVGAAAYVVRPTRAYGPVAIGCDVLEIVYLVLVYQLSPLSLSFAQNGGGSANGMSIALAIGFAGIILILIIVQLLHLAGDAVTTAEDMRRPYERLWYTFPVR